MRVERRQRNQNSFSDVKVGDVFTVPDSVMLYIKTEPMHDSLYKVNSVSLNSGSCHYWADCQVVEIHNEAFISFN